MQLRDKGWLTHSGMTDGPTPKNIINFLRFAYHEKQLREKEAPLDDWLETIGIAPYGKFDAYGKYISGDFNLDLISSIKQSSRYQDGYWHTDMPHPKGQKEPMTILHLTDLHIRKTKAKRFINLHEKLLGRQYDIVIITGDIVHECQDDLTKGPLSLLRDIDSKHKLFVRGNHDGHTWADSQKVSDILESETGFKDISYLVETIDMDGYNIGISGIPDRSLYKTSPYFKERSWKRAIYDSLPLLEKSDFRIGAFHRPCDVFGAFEENGKSYLISDDAYNLILAGHIHEYGLNIKGFNAKFWLGFHGVDDGLNNHKGGYMMPSEETIFSVGPGSLEMIYLRLPIIRTYIPLFPRFGVRKAGGEVLTIYKK
ncbi:MAG: metallophosphoesterase [Candidatus Woesearchaeota archaeon]|nr:metallophosphoesterase [Candidatus Woesearchaeota archaeon]